MHIALLGAASSIHIRKIATGLSRRGHHLTLLTLHGHASHALDFPPDVEVVALPGDSYFTQGRVVAHHLRERKVDLCYAHYASGYGLLLRKSHFHPSVLAVWGSDVYDFPQKSPLHRWILRRNLRFPDALFSTSHVMAKQAQRYVDRPFRITPFGVDLTAFQPLSEPKPPSDTLRIGFFKGMDSQYAPQDVLSAFEALIRDQGVRDRYPYWHLDMVGDGPQRDSLEEWVAVHGLEDKVSFYGRIDHEEMPDRLRCLDIYVAPSIRESFGVSAVEAMACGIPVVVSDADGFQEVTNQGSVARMVPRKDSHALKEAMLAVIREPEKTKDLTVRALQRVRDHYDWEENLDNMERGLIAVAEGEDEGSVARGGDPVER